MAQEGNGGEKTEKATPKRRKDAREKGQVRKSQDVITVVMLLALFSSLKFFGPNMMKQIMTFMEKVFSGSYNNTVLDAGGFTFILKEAVVTFIYAMLPIFGVAILAALVVNYVQVGFLYSTEALMPKLSRLNPASGLKRMFSIQTVYELFKSIGKLIIVGILGYMQVSKNLKTYLNLMDMGAMKASAVIFNTVINACFVITAALAVFSILDYVYQWFKYEKDLRMTKYEIKMEYKQQEGDPEIKAKIKQKQREMASQRMMQEVPGADVVITNPTHVAVAIKYDEEKTGAPIILAKGLDLVAQRIKEIAGKNKVEIYESKEIARALYAQCEIGQEIPAELYGAVAEILAYVYKMKNGGR